MRAGLVIIGIISLFLFPLVNAQNGHMTLLAVSETSNGQMGGVADLFLEIKPGSGRVFLETFPVTKVDTQISTRFAKEIACDYADVDCDKFDFFYTITADSSIIAGPSAGGAITVLTFSLIRGVEYDETVSITGTINSGGLIGPVGGLKAKMEAANKYGLSKVLIPPGELIDETKNISDKNQTLNGSLDLDELSKKLDIEIIQVATLDEAIFEFTGKKFREQKKDLTISQEYKDTMKNLAIGLCSRSTRLKKGIEDMEFSTNLTERLLRRADNLSNRGKESFSDTMYYSSASYCFGANVEYNFLALIEEGLDEEKVEERVDDLRDKIIEFDKEIEDEKIRTLTDLESYMVVKERLKEANDFLIYASDEEGNINSSLRNLAYSIERINSARSWSQFMENGGKEFDFNDDVVRDACKTKLSEVEERLQYVQQYFTQNLDSTKTEMNYAYEDLIQGNHELCLFKASKAKANVDSILGVFGVRNNNVKSLLEQKLEIVERNLVEEIDKGVFPILGYSYFEYANSLKDTDPFSALLYSEYALELSNLDIYFEDKENIIDFFKNTDTQLLKVLIIGILIGVIVGNILRIASNKKRKKRK